MGRAVSHGTHRTGAVVLRFAQDQPGSNCIAAHVRIAEPHPYGASHVM